MRSPERLKRSVRRSIEDPRNEVYLSPISIWEAYTLVRRGRLRIRSSFREWLDEMFAPAPLLEAPFNNAVAIEVTRIELPRGTILATCFWLPRHWYSDSR